MNNIDLHIHTTASDGTFSPGSIVSLAHSLNLSALAITDHDNISGYAEAKAMGDKLGVEIIPGIELSTNYKGAVHILGYGMDPSHPILLRELQGIIDARNDRNRKIVAQMQADHIPVSYDEMSARFGASIGRPHFAEILIENGFASSTDDAFHRFLGKGCRYWVPRSLLSLSRCIEVISLSGGIPVLAHPFEYSYQEKSFSELIEVCIDLGIQGVECRHSSHTLEQMAFLEQQANHFGLLKTGGSDFHGAIKPGICLGTGSGLVQVPYDWLTALKKKQQS